MGIRLEEIEEDCVGDRRGDCYRTVNLVLRVRAFSDADALAIGLEVLKIMREDQIIGPADGDVVPPFVA